MMYRYNNFFMVKVGLICLLHSSVQGMKQNVLFVEPLLSTNDEEAELLASSDAESRTGRAKALARVVHSGAKSYDNELLFVLPDGEDDIVCEGLEETSTGYLNAGISKLKSAGYDKIAEASEFVDTKFVAGIVTATALSTFVWLITNSIKKNKAAKTGQKLKSKSVTTSELEKAHAVETLGDSQISQNNDVQVKQPQMAPELKVDDSRHVAEVALLKEQLALMQKVLEAEQVEKQRLQARLEEEIEQNEANVEVNRLLLSTHPNPQEFMKLMENDGE